MSDLEVQPSLRRESFDEMPEAARGVAPAVRFGDE